MAAYQLSQLTREFIINKVKNTLIEITENKEIPKDVNRQLSDMTHKELLDQFCHNSQILKDGPYFIDEGGIYKLAITSGMADLQKVSEIKDFNFKKYIAMHVDSTKVMRELYAEKNPEIQSILNIKGFGLDEIVASGNIEKIGLIYTHSLNFSTAANTALKDYKTFQDYFDHNPNMCVLPKNRYMKFDSNKDKTLQIDRTKVNSKIADKTTSKQVDRKL